MDSTGSSNGNNISCENYEYSDDSNMVRFITDEDRGITNVEKFFGKGKKRQTKIIFFSDVILKFTGELKSNRGDHHRVGFWRAKCTTFQHGSLKESIQHYNKVIRQKCEGGHSMLGPDITLSDLKRYGQYLKENYLEEREDRRDIFRVSHIGCVADQYWILSEKCPGYNSDAGESWFHMTCLGMNESEEYKDDEDWVCQDCHCKQVGRRPRTRRNKGSARGKADKTRGEKKLLKAKESESLSIKIT